MMVTETRLGHGRPGGACPPAHRAAPITTAATRIDGNAKQSERMDGRSAHARAQLDERGLLLLYAIGLGLLGLAFLLANL